jgi:hypothetical protein
MNNGHCVYSCVVHRRSMTVLPYSFSRGGERTEAPRIGADLSLMESLSVGSPAKAGDPVTIVFAERSNLPEKSG